MSDTPITDANTYPGWIKVDDGTDSPWHTDRQEWTKAEVARQLERQLTTRELEWCALCQRQHPAPAMDYCPARGR